MQQLSVGQNSSTPSVSLFLSVIALNSIKIKCFWIPKTQSDFEYEDFNQLKVNKYLGHKHIARFRWLCKTHIHSQYTSLLYTSYTPLHVSPYTAKSPSRGRPRLRKRNAPWQLSLLNEEGFVQRGHQKTPCSGTWQYMLHVRTMSVTWLSTYQTCILTCLNILNM